MDINHTLNGFLRLNSWDFAYMLGLVDMSGTWHLGLHVNPPLGGHEDCCLLSK